MKLKHTSWKKSGGITRRQLITNGFLGFAGWMLSPMRIAEAALQDDLERVTLIPGMAGGDGPLLEFRIFNADPDVEVEQHLRLQLNQRKDILNPLKKKIGFKKQVKLSLENIQVRLMFVPQLQGRSCRILSSLLPGHYRLSIQILSSG